MAASVSASGSSTVTRTATVALFARAPELGAVKTRLARSIGARAALAAHEALLRDAIERLAGNAAYRLELWLAGDLNWAWLHALLQTHEVPLCAQAGADLGARMRHAAQRIAAQDRLPVIVGSDLPGIDETYVQGAIEAVRNCDLVLGPTEDGGYGLIAMRTVARDLFQDVPWGTDAVLTATLARARSLGLRTCLLETCWDVDELDDYRRWQDTVTRSMLSGPPRSRR